MKCFFEGCKRKVNTFSTPECVCGHYFCLHHRQTFEHSCKNTKQIEEDHKKKIQKENPIIKKDVWNLLF